LLLDKERILAIVRTMSKVTSKLQVTIPKAIADQYGIEPGDEIEFQAAGNVIRVIPPGRRVTTRLSVEERLRLFDEARGRQRLREQEMELPKEPPTERDWRREDLYTRGKPR
jgi:AbrB family looped-hinge helix DNA binding protein